ncbi:hypothetical protein LTR78_005650 [Recurvomyces mirabilis]|uniref:Uncharacterized protein n=1 Tax=Recurvomyces mirabilis TaxID=574656 RepID=A0AAE1C1G0_9PEZI|nr:hypothetical protein LTR78_005650 [Recurvomyces mirabilis]KAK5151227.1 hypothetical protein LTS14_009397 [Recurvomyces mirabilis]
MNDNALRSFTVGLDIPGSPWDVATRNDVLNPLQSLGPLEKITVESEGSAMQHCSNTAWPGVSPLSGTIPRLPHPIIDEALAYADLEGAAYGTYVHGWHVFRGRHRVCLGYRGADAAKRSRMRALLLRERVNLLMQARDIIGLQRCLDELDVVEIQDRAKGKGKGKKVQNLFKKFEECRKARKG